MSKKICLILSILLSGCYAGPMMVPDEVYLGHGKAKCSIEWQAWRRADEVRVRVSGFSRCEENIKELFREKKIIPKEKVKRPQRPMGGEV